MSKQEDGRLLTREELVKLNDLFFKTGGDTPFPWANMVAKAQIAKLARVTDEQMMENFAAEYQITARRILAMAAARAEKDRADTGRLLTDQEVKLLVEAEGNVKDMLIDLVRACGEVAFADGKETQIKEIPKKKYNDAVAAERARIVAIIKRCETDSLVDWVQAASFSLDDWLELKGEVK